MPGVKRRLPQARLGMKTILFAMSLDSIAMMPCNPSIGGTSKGHLVREIDALGGEMGRNIDHTYIQSRMINTAKGPAGAFVYARRPIKSRRTMQRMKHVLERQENLQLRQNEVIHVDVQEGRVVGVQTATGGVLSL